MREDWIEIFEEIVGRKPTAAEVEAGEEVDFDVKSILEISGLSLITSDSSQKQVIEKVTTPRSSLWKKVVTGYKNLSSKKRYVLYSFAFLVLAVVGLGVVVANSSPYKRIQELDQAVSGKHYDTVAQLLTTKEEKWTKEEVQSYLAYLEEEDIDWIKELENLTQFESDEKIYFDEHGNRLFGLEESGRTLGLFPEYRLVVYPVEVSMKTNLSDLKLDNQAITKDQMVSLGSKKWGMTPYPLIAKTDAGSLDTTIVLPFEETRDNRLQVDLKTKEVEFVAKLESSVSDFEQVKLIINEKQVADGLRKKMKVVNGQEVEVHVQVKYAGSEYTTEKKKVYVKMNQLTMEVELAFSEEIEKKLTDQARQKEDKKKAAEAEAAKKAEEVRQQAERQAAEEKEREEYATRARPNLDLFLKEYRDAVFRSVSQRNDQYAKYYDVSSAVYQEMINWTMGGGAVRAKIDYYTPGRLTLENIEYRDGVFYATTYEDFSVHYVDKRPTTVNQKTKVYSIKFENDEFRIFDITVSE
ncbi:hypothetical protein [Streptococcus danieliae]|uniref:TcaA second domain-containing protein n=1 Tax=Streptococcus danieliae TaxID=747656 RepID=UPI0026F07126|nr:hypothetical protein [Streptococcus danieliae]